jgi:hypothetical protein
VNYYNRLALANKVKQLVEAQFKHNTPRAFDPPIAYSYSGGKIFITHIERYKYMSQFKRWFTTIRVMLDDGTFVPLAKLRTKHLTKIFQYLTK